MNDILKPLEQLYINAKFDEGIKLLKDNQTSLEGDIYHYNLGTFYLKNSQAVESRYHLEMAKKLKFDQGMVDNNIAYTKEQLGLERVETISNPLARLQVSVDSMSPVYFESFLLLCLCFSLFIYRRKKSFVGGILLIVLGVGPFVFKKIVEKQFSKAIIMNAASLKEGPSEAFESSGEAPPGVKVYLTHQRNKKWFYLKYPKTLSGWIHEDNLKFIR